jgi:DNA/RNA-binding domain of Phe-tRNA-synthetase-like protein
MIAISIEPALKRIVPDLALGVLVAPVHVTAHDDRLWAEIDRRIREIQSGFRLEVLGDIPEVKAVRDAYRALGKDPSRYRGSAEALLRRTLQGKGLYRINTVVDVNNLISLETGQPVGSYDLTRVTPPVLFRIGQPGEPYKGIGKDQINIDGLPVFADAIGPFGSPTSDSERTMITLATTSVMMVIVSFTGQRHLANHLDRATRLLSAYAGAHASGIETLVIT